MARAGSTVAYPLTPAVDELARLVGKEQWLALVVDLLREFEGPDLDDQTLRRLIVDRLDILHSAGLVPRTVPARVARLEG